MGRRKRLNKDADFTGEDKVEDKCNIAPLQMPMIPIFVDDLSPTPTRFLKNVEDSEVFNETCETSCSDNFKQQNSSKAPFGRTQTENSTVLTLPPEQPAPIPSVILESVAEEVDENILTDNPQDSHPSATFTASTVDGNGADIVYSAEPEENMPAESGAVLGNSVERRLIEVLIQIPDFGLIPVRIPFDALAQATFPLEASPVISISSSIPQTVAPLTASPVTQPENTASVKQILKATLKQNSQHQQIHSVPLRPPLDRRTNAPPASPPSLPLKRQQPAINPVPASVDQLIQKTIPPARRTGPRSAKTPRLSSTSETLFLTQDSSEAVQSPCSSGNDDDSEEKKEENSRS